MTLDHSGHMSSPSSYQGQGKFPACGLGLSRVRREGGGSSGAAKLAGRVGLHLCARTAVSVYNSLGAAASITPVCCDPGGNAQTEQPARGGCIHAAEEGLSEPVCQVTATPVSSHLLRDVSEIRGTASPHNDTGMDAGVCHWDHYRLLQQ